MQTGIDINICVDSVAALCNKKLNGSIWLMDNSIYEGSGQGSARLATSCGAGQVVTWKITAADLQTPAVIKFISFHDVHYDWYPHEVIKGNQNSNELDLNVWSAIIPSTMIIGRSYKYRLAVQIGEGKNSVLFIDSPSLRRII